VETPLGNAQVVVTNGNQSSAIQPLNIVSAAPGIFTIVRATDYSPVTAANPAHAGDYMVIFCTGLGATRVPIPTGSGATDADWATATFSLQIIGFNNGPAASFLYAGLAPGYPGLYQVNFQLPQIQGSAANITFFGNGWPSNTVTLPVH